MTINDAIPGTPAVPGRRPSTADQDTPASVLRQIRAVQAALPPGWLTDTPFCYIEPGSPDQDDDGSDR